MSSAMLGSNGALSLQLPQGTVTISPDARVPFTFPEAVLPFNDG